MAVETLTPKHLAGLPIIKASDRPPYMNILIYGESGVGKTRLAGSADALPAMRKVLVVDVEGGTMTLEHAYPDVDVVRIKSWEDMANVYNSLYAGGHGYSTVILDSLTEIQKFNMDQIMGGLDDDSKVDLDVPSMREWGKNLSQMRRFVRAFRDLDMHTIFTALAQTVKNPRSGVLTKKPYLNGKLADEVAAFLDVVVYMYKKEIDGENQRLLLTESTDEFVAKDRTGKLATIIQNPTMGDILKQMEKKQ